MNELLVVVVVSGDLRSCWEEYFETGQVWRDNLPFKEGGKKQKIRSGMGHGSNGMG